MPFLNPALFIAGAAAAAGPIIIHLLNRRRFRILDWAAMEFLLQSQRKNRRRMRLEELILLLLRVLAIVLMGTALARPLLSKADLLDLGKSGADIVVVLDDSFSMGQKHGADVVFAKAQAALAQIIEKLGQQDRLAIYLVSRPSDPLRPLDYLSNTEALQQEIRSLTPSDFATDLVSPILKAVELFTDKNARNPEKRLYILSDFRRREWNMDGQNSQGHRIAAALGALDKKRFRIYGMDFGADDPANLSITELTCTDKHIVKNVRLQFRVTVVNQGAQSVHNVPISVQVGEVKLPAKIIERLDPAQPKTVEFSYRFKEAGAVAVSAFIPGDPLASDNARHLALQVLDAIPVLIVNGNPDPQPFVNETDYLVAALDPGKKNLSGYRPEVVLDRDLPNARLSNYDCLVLGNVGSLLPDMVKAIEDYVRGGGGLIIFLGDKVDREFYNTQLFKDGRGLLPLALDPPRGDLERRQKFSRLKREDENHELMRVFTGAGEALLDLVPVYRYHPLRAERLGSSGVKVLASLVDPNQPQPVAFVVEKTYGRGRVILIGSSMNAAWNDWPKSISYPIVMNEMVKYLTRSPRYENTQPVGAPLRREIEREFFNATITLKTPQFPQQPAVRLAPTLQGEQMFVAWPPALTQEPAKLRSAPADRSLPGLDRAGIYTLELASDAKTRLDFYARNVEADEGRLEKAQPAVVQQILKELPFEYRQGATDSAAVTAAAASELWRIVLFVLLGVLVIETILAQRFGHYSS
jgi:hypothetical protein